MGNDLWTQSEPDESVLRSLTMNPTSLHFKLK